MATWPLNLFLRFPFWYFFSVEDVKWFLLSHLLKISIILVFIWHNKSCAQKYGDEFLLRPCERRSFLCFIVSQNTNTASFEIFVSIKNIALKLNFYNRKILVSTQILIKYLITITECRALVSASLQYCFQILFFRKGN